MSVARRSFVLLLLACWLPAMLHCRLEAAGMLFEAECCGTAQPHSIPVADHGCAADSCEVAEGHFSVPASQAGKAPLKKPCAPPLVALSGFRLAELIVPPAAGVAEITTAPPELIRPWILVAPGLVSPRAP